ncbi:MAG: ATP-binding cassette domain-containing protein [Treponema sp.]|nr:ATP-binding cassette domain-containing protein [Treponema sp.]
MSNITKSFSDNEIFQAVSFNLKAGEVHILMEENSSGKSTLMNILMGIYHGDQGKYQAFGGGPGSGQGGTRRTPGSFSLPGY